MRVLTVTFYFLLSITLINGQEIGNSNEFDKDIKNENQIKNYLKFDFSSLLIPKNEILGFIGSDYKRIKIFINSATKDLNKKDLYVIKGFSIVDKNVCDFEGTIIIEQVKEFKNTQVYFDELNKDSVLKARGLLIGNYSFNENKDKKNSGVFQGKIKLYWYLDWFDLIQYDNLEGYSDGYRNNQYSGIWRSYQTGKEIICNWGELRIPNSGDLDIGEGEFFPNPKYKNNGWADYK
jgi:hypothetical protein